ncbi:hypothetical protein ABZP36_013722 [Zizania latifolia]
MMTANHFFIGLDGELFVWWTAITTATSQSCQFADHTAASQLLIRSDHRAVQIVVSTMHPNSLKTIDSGKEEHRIQRKRGISIAIKVEITRFMPRTEPRTPSLQH